MIGFLISGFFITIMVGGTLAVLVRNAPRQERLSRAFGILFISLIVMFCLLECFFPGGTGELISLVGWMIYGEHPPH